MRAVKAFGVGEKSVQTRFGAEINGFTAILGSRKVLRVGIKDAFANCMETLVCLKGNYRRFHNVRIVLLHDDS